MNLMNTDCLTYEQLKSYSLNKSEKEERAQLYMHITTCELCACAVNGFAAIPFTFSDVDAIQHQIDIKTNMKHANPLTIARVFFVGISLACIFVFYNFANSFSKNRSNSNVSENAKSVISKVPSTVNFIPTLEKQDLTNRIISKQKFQQKRKLLERASFSIEYIENITPDLTPQRVDNSDVSIDLSYNANVIYIYDLKVTDYYSLYFNYKAPSFEIKGHTPANKENKESVNYFFDKEADQVIAADQVLKSALSAFNRGKYNKALEDFQLLLQNNSNDINSLFYSSLAYYQIGKYNLSIQYLETVLQNPNNVFHPEAKWNLALVNLKIGNKLYAKKLFQEILEENGFYSKKAADKLKGKQL